MDEPGAVAPLLELLTGLREAVAEKLKEKIGPEGQQLVIADIRMEEFSFVLMSRYMNLVEGNKVKPQWTDFLHSLALAVANLRLGGFAPEECRAIESELEAWGQEFDQGDRDQLLRLKATLDRSLRLSGLYTRKILDLFPQKAERLGSALGVNEQAIRVFSEADIRSHPVFQLSKLSSLLLKRVREAASLPPWDVIVPGRALGRLLLSSRLSGLTMSDGGSTIAVLEEVEGDEEIPPRVAALIVPHATPHLSHLAVRARQAGTVFAVCEEPALFRSLKEMAGKDVLFDAAGAKPEISLSGAGKQESRPAPAAGRPAIRETGLTDGASVLMLPDVTVENSGSKAYGARRLEELSRRPNAGFGTPASVVLPFGVMERALSERPELQKRYRNLIGKLGWAGREEFRGILEELAKIVRQTEVPPSILDEATVRFGEGKRLMVRSSSNCEDLEGLSGAGLYETEANVSADRLAEAVRNVWASLWTERAAANRASLGISHGQVHMAVLIQEMLLPDYSFVIHTVNPITGKKGEVYIELAAGLGETLASGEVPGTPYRMVCSPANEVHILSFASFSHSILPGAPAELIRETLDYSKVGLSVDRGLRTAAAVRLADVARSVEKALGRPQDIEGLLSGSDIRLVQSRPQQGLQPEGT
jgi:phosphoglucan,water dikinase